MNNPNIYCLYLSPKVFKNEADLCVQGKLTKQDRLCKNAFYSPVFLNVVLEKWIAFLPFFSKILTAMRFPNIASDRPNNGYVEGYHKGIKSELKTNQASLGKFGTLKIGRFISFQRKRMENDIKQLSIGYNEARSKRISKKKVHSEMVAYEELDNRFENWKNKAQPNTSSFFGSQSLSALNSQEK